jgi:hypothetical protein
MHRASAVRGTAKRAAAVEALAVVQKLRIGDATDLATGNRTSGAAQQCTEQRPGQPTNDNAQGAADSADNDTDLGARPGAGSTAGCASDATQSATCGSTRLAGNNVRRIANRTESHQKLLATSAKKAQGTLDVRRAWGGSEKTNRERWSIGLPMWQ